MQFLTDFITLFLRALELLLAVLVSVDLDKLLAEEVDLMSEGELLHHQDELVQNVIVVLVHRVGE